MRCVSRRSAPCRTRDSLQLERAAAPSASSSVSAAAMSSASAALVSRVVGRAAVEAVELLTGGGARCAP